MFTVNKATFAAIGSVIAIEDAIANVGGQHRAL